MKSILLTLLLTSLISGTTVAQSASEKITQQLEAIVDGSDIPGFAISIVSKDSVLFQKGFGFANLADKTQFTKNSIINIGSMTKPLISIALMKLVEEGKVHLEDDINTYLPFKVVNPHYPNDKMTIRQLATHTSSLTDGEDDMLVERSYLFHGFVDFKEKELPEGYYPYFQLYKTNKPMSMEELLRSVYAKDGKLYGPDNFLASKPGTEYNYTNLGATLLALIIERITNSSFSDYTKKEILQPLGMTESSWSLTGIPTKKLTSLYMSNGLLIPHYMLITYPDGGLFTNVADFSQFLMDMIRGLNGEGKLLKDASYKEIMSNQLTDQNFPNNNFETSKGFMWNVNREGDNISMNGADPGIMTYTLMTTKGNVGILIFMNISFYGNESLEQDFNKIRGTLFQHIGELLKGG